MSAEIIALHEEKIADVQAWLQLVGQAIKEEGANITAAVLITIGGDDQEVHTSKFRVGASDLAIFSTVLQAHALASYGLGLPEEE